MSYKYLDIFQRYSGIAGVLVIWTGVLTGMQKAQLGLIDTRPISHLGIDPRSGIWFSGGLLLSAFLFINFAFYVRRAFHVNNWFLLFFLIGQAGQIITAISPYGENSGYKLIHTVAAFTLAFSLPFLIQQFTVSQSGNNFKRLYMALLSLELCTFVVGMGIFIFTKGIAPLGEALPAIGFHVWIIAVTYTAFSDT